MNVLDLHRKLHVLLAGPMAALTLSLGSRSTRVVEVCVRRTQNTHHLVGLVTIEASDAAFVCVLGLRLGDRCRWDREGCQQRERSFETSRKRRRVYSFAPRALMCP